jgi:hypothetical protein
MDARIMLKLVLGVLFGLLLTVSFCAAGLQPFNKKTDLEANML